MGNCPIQRYGPAALLITLPFPVSEDSPALLDRLSASIDVLPLPGIREIVRGYVTLLIEFSAAEFCTVDAVQQISECVGALSFDDLSRSEGHLVEVPVQYDGPDLELVAAHTGLSVAEIVERHTAAIYTVHFLGFAPGFPYLSGLDPALATPRLGTPRPRVPPGSIGIGGSQTGIYSIATPGGWNLIGRTSHHLFNPCSTSIERIFALKPGDRIRFVPSEMLPARAEAVAVEVQLEPATPVFRVLRRSAGLSLQDKGRHGWKRFGVPTGGALDWYALECANLLAGNQANEPVLELCLGGQHLELLRSTHVALAGADLNCLIESPATGRTVELRPWSCLYAEAGSVIRFRNQGAGVWSYLAIPGGFEGRSDLGSFSGNDRAGLGQKYLDNDLVMGRLPAEPGWIKPLAQRKLHARARPVESRPASLRIWPGPQWDWFSPEQRELFFMQHWKVSAQSDRTGYRLQGQAIPGERPELLSEPTLPGSIQILPTGQPVVSLHDGPTVSGYPRLGLVHEKDLRGLIQTKAGDPVQFVRSYLE